MNSPILSLVVPCYNEHDVLPITADILRNKIEYLVSCGKISSKSYIVFVDDGSTDDTWDIIKRLNETNAIFKGVKLSKNRGHQNAVLAGLMSAKEYSDAVISLDADLQDDVDAIDKMVEKYLDGAHIVFGVRSSRKKDSFFKRFTAEGFYKILRLFSDDPKSIIFNHADYRLMSKTALEALNEYGEVNLFLRGIIPTIGYKQDIVYYERKERFAGESKYPLKKMLALAFQGITSFSIKPMRIIFTIGVCIFFISIALSVYFLVRYFNGHTVVGWATIAVSIWGIGGLLQMSIGVIGEYIGKIYLETKHRPKYFIETVL
ncbi:glycosyltransferase family 2 protein [Treponema denticola]|uniref:glycosyltransferase family 2 protein n=1 Tax=Treponema denticola TaxID=158 RepID=UPI0020A50762|nr:glycosyltransferase family 2 protein [Treponema denticola]